MHRPMTLIRLPLVLPLVLVALAGCASLDEPPVERMPDSAMALPGETLPDGSVRVDTEDARIAQLWSAAEDAVLSGQDEQALTHLFSALEIEPQNAMLWSRAAELQLDNDEAAIAETFAVKSNAFAGDNRGLQYRNWLIIEHARTMRGDLLGVRSAHRKVQQLQYQ